MYRRLLASLLFLLFLSGCAPQPEVIRMPQTTYAERSEGPLASWFRNGFAAKKVVVWGNSTVSDESEFFTTLEDHARLGRELEGLNVSPVITKPRSMFWRTPLVEKIGNIYNYGSTGTTLREMLLDQNGTSSGIERVIAAQPDLLIIRGPLINDVRTGSTNLEQAKQLLVEAIERIRHSSSKTAILLLTENSLLCTDSAHWFWQTPPHWVKPNEAAQKYTNILHEAVMSLDGEYPNVQVFDLMAYEYGTSCMAKSSLMKDQLHPNAAGRRREAELIIQIIGNEPKP